MRNGLMDGYTRWISDEAGEEEDVNGGAPVNEEGQPENNGGREDEEHPVHDHEEDAEADHVDQDAGHEDQDVGHDEYSSWVRDPHFQELLVKEALNARGAAREKAKMAQLEKDAITKLYEGCNDGDTRLNVTLGAMEMKAKHKWTDESFDDNMAFWHDRLPKGNTCPTSIAEAKKVLCPLDLPHVKYHVCINDCMIYRGEDEDKTTCSVCGVSRYKRGKKVPRKVVWYFPITPRLQRYFVDPEEAKPMTWHADRKKLKEDDPNPDPEKEDMLRHPSDGSQWTALDLEYPDFGKEPRNLRIGVSADGVNPFGVQSSTHSTWPVFVCIYNLPPWKCMKKKYITMCMLVQGPKQPGTDLNLYLQLFKEDLETLWKGGVNTWDAVTKEYFPMKAAVITTVHDYLGYVYFSGQVVQGFYASVRCMDNKTYRQLPKDPGYSKTMFQGSRRWLPKKHAWRKQRH